MNKDKQEKDNPIFLFDNEWVIVKNDWDLVARRTSESLHTPLMTGKEFKQALKCYDKSDDNILHLYNRGLISSDVFWKKFLESQGVKPSSKNIMQASSALEMLTTDVDPEAIEVLNEIAEQQHPLFMVSNSTPEIFQGNKSRHNYFDLFIRCYFSFNIGFRKPEIGAYLRSIQDYELDPKNCVFVDDKPENLDGALAAGIGNVVHHKIGEGSLKEKLKPYLEK